MHQLSKTMWPQVGFREKNTYVFFFVGFFFNCDVFEAGNMSEDLGEFNKLSLLKLETTGSEQLQNLLRCSQVCHGQYLTFNRALNQFSQWLFPGAALEKSHKRDFCQKMD